MEAENVFKRLNAVDISEQLRVKNKFNYLPWSAAWGMVMQEFPDAVYSVVKSDTGWIYHTDGNTCWVETSVTINGTTRNETLPVLDHRNQPIKLENITSFNAGNSIKRCLVKNLALFGLGLSLWTGEELSDDAKLAKAKTSAKLADIKKEIVFKSKSLVESGADRNSILEVIATYNNGNSNPNSIKSTEVAEMIVEALDNFSDN